MSQYEIMKNLLPPGHAFSEENKTVHKFLSQISLVFDDCKDMIDQLFKEVPGEFNLTLPLWCKLFQIPYDETRHMALNKEVIARLTAKGGQSKKYLEDQLSLYLREGEKLRIKSFPEELKIHVYGVNKVKKSRSGHRCALRLGDYDRNESLVKRCLEIRHAETEARYYG